MIRDPDRGENPSSTPVGLDPYEILGPGICGLHKPMAALPNLPSRRGEVHSKAATHLAMHHNLLRGFHTNGHHVRGARRHHGNKGGKLKNHSSKHVELRHLQRGNMHLPI
nr:solute carrier family 15 (peptide/histidine transporter), member 3/4 [Ipomoea batatas]